MYPGRDLCGTRGCGGYAAIDGMGLDEVAGAGEAERSGVEMGIESARSLSSRRVGT